MNGRLIVDDGSKVEDFETGIFINCIFHYFQITGNIFIVAVEPADPILIGHLHAEVAGGETASVFLKFVILN